MKIAALIFAMLISACSSTATAPAGPTRTIPDYLSHLATGTTYHAPPLEIPAELIPPLVVTATVTLYGISYTASENEEATDIAFVVAVRKASEQYSYNWVDESTDEELIAIAKTFCADWNAGFTYEQITLDLATAVDEPELVKVVVDAGTRIFCPQHTEKLP